MTFSSIYFVLLGYRVQRGHEVAGMKVGNERACGHSQAVVSVHMYYGQGTAE